MAKRGNFLLSNRVISVIALILAAGILLDGRLYNRSPNAIGIYPLASPETISISQQDQMIMAFTNNSNQWLMTRPTDAPLNAERIQVLLDSNNQVSRSYATSDLPLADLFPNPVVLDVNGRQFHLGELEPVSKLRYVMANNRVYLQADHVIPMIRAGANAFLDLTITQTVAAVEIDQQPLHNPDAWSSLNALGIVPRSKLQSDPVTSVVIKQKNKHNKIFQLHIQDGVAILASPLQPYGYLISQQQSNQLGLAKYL